MKEMIIKNFRPGLTPSESNSVRGGMASSCVCNGGASFSCDCNSQTSENTCNCNGTESYDCGCFSHSN
ncbi:MAG: hypothetical protein K2L59_05430 [Muribaculaceae bacterium]|nr:hypothetical protein [Muribaculaceae bacterium]